jgi:5'-3' exonuclease
VDVYLIDGTYELFRHYYAVPSARDRDGREVGAVRGVLVSLLGMMRTGTHIGVATDHVIESFRNELWPEYKTGDGVAPDLLAQFPLLEEMLSALGVVVWPMVEHEADDALAAAAERAAADPRVDRVLICTPDKDLAQSVRGTRVVQMDRRRRTVRDEAGVVARFGVMPASIPDYLALVGDAADGYPGLPGWGARSTAAVLAKYHHLESIPGDAATWGVNAARAGALAATLEKQRDWALLFRDLATLRTDLDVFQNVDELCWTGPTPAFAPLAWQLDGPTAEIAPSKAP